MIRIGVSSCLLGQKVRYDGGHKKEGLLTDLWSRHLTFVPVCPELEVGMGVPRPPIHLEKTKSGVRLVETKSGRDWTAEMEAFSVKRSRALESAGLSGFIFKKNSPSCGVWRVKIHEGSKEGRGVFADVFCRMNPLLPVEEEGRLQDDRLRETFLIRVFAHRRLTDFFAARWTLGTLSAFHAGEKLLLMAHSPAAYKTLGRLVAGAKGKDRNSFQAEYMRVFMEALETPAPVSRHVNVFQHMAGYFKKSLPEDEKTELHGAISDYGRSLAPWLVPATLLRHHARRAGVKYLLDQSYLAPHPKELLLRSHV